MQEIGADLLTFGAGAKVVGDVSHVHSQLMPELLAADDRVNVILQYHRNINVRIQTNRTRRTPSNLGSSLDPGDKPWWLFGVIGASSQSSIRDEQRNGRGSTSGG